MYYIVYNCMHATMHANMQIMYACMYASIYEYVYEHAYMYVCRYVMLCNLAFVQRHSKNGKTKQGHSLLQMLNNITKKDKLHQLAKLQSKLKESPVAAHTHTHTHTQNQSTDIHRQLTDGRDVQSLCQVVQIVDTNMHTNTYIHRHCQAQVCYQNRTRWGHTTVC